MSRLTQLAINEEGFVFDPSTGESFSVNKTGALILKELKENKSSLEIIAKIQEKYEVADEDIQHDISDFIEHLRLHKIL